MYSRHHAAVSAVVAAGLLAVLPLGSTTAVTALVWLTLTAAGVFIDLDHFLVARLVRGDWKNTRRALANPRAAVVDQSALFDAGDLWPLERLLSHAVIVPVAIAAAWVTGGAVGDAVDPGMTANAAAIAMAVALYVHVLTDLVWDVWRQDGYHEQVREIGDDPRRA